VNPRESRKQTQIGAAYLATSSSYQALIGLDRPHAYEKPILVH
jgi:hypothetical protein